MSVVEMRGICKSFGTVHANADVSIEIKKGEVLSLLGENGAGKTTLMNVLYGLVSPDSGKIFINDKEVQIKSPLDAAALGISMVHQHFMLINSLTVAENVVLGFEPRKGVAFDRAAAFAEVEKLSQQYGLKVDPYAEVSKLPVGMKQRVEILKALYRKSEILILDEPTAVLTPGEADDLFEALQQFKENGKAIVLITHKLKETMKSADRITILRQGRVVETLPRDGANVEQLAEKMVGRRITFSIDRKRMEGERPVLLSLKGATLRDGDVAKLDNISIDVRGGEIVGIAGVDGNGQTELIEALTGIAKLDEGEISIAGEPVKSPTPVKMIERGMGHIPEDRSVRGVIRDYSVSENLILGYQKTSRFSGKVQLKLKDIAQFAKETVKKFDIRCSGIEEPLSALSGGNQQKVVIGRVMSENPQIVIAAQPTRGVDIGAVEYIHECLIELRDSGKAILLISADLDEVLKLSDRIQVLYDGRIVSNDATENYNERRLGALMTGQEDETRDVG
jgi:simple sugar transport system ATP-binding protein